MCLYLDRERTIEVSQDWDTFLGYIRKGVTNTPFYYLDKANQPDFTYLSNIRVPLSLIFQRQISSYQLEKLLPEDKVTTALKRLGIPSSGDDDDNGDDGEDIFKQKYTIAFLKHIAKKPKALSDVNGKRVGSLISKYKHILPVGNYREAAWAVLNIIGEGVGLGIELLDDGTIKYTLKDAQEAKPPTPKEIQRKKIDKAIKEWVSSISYPDHNQYHEYEEHILKVEPGKYTENEWEEKEKELAPVNSNIVIPMLFVTTPRGLSITFRDILGIPDIKGHLRIVEEQASALEEVIDNIRNNAIKVLRTQQYFLKYFPSSQEEIYYSLLEDIQEKAMIYALGTNDSTMGPIWVETKKTLALLFLEGISLEYMKERLARELAGQNR